MALRPPHFSDGYQAGIFTKTGSVTVGLRKGVRRKGKLQVKRYKVLFDVYTDTGGTGDAQSLKDCLLITKLEGTSIAVLANGGPNQLGPNCAKAEEFAGRLDRIHYVK